MHEVKGPEVSPRRGSTRYQSISNSPNLTNSGDPLKEPAPRGGIVFEAQFRGTGTWILKPVVFQFLILLILCMILFYLDDKVTLQLNIGETHIQEKELTLKTYMRLSNHPRGVFLLRGKPR